MSDDAVSALGEWLVEARVDVDGTPWFPEWDDSRLDLSWALDVLRSAAPE